MRRGSSTGRATERVAQLSSTFDRSREVSRWRSMRRNVALTQPGCSRESLTATWKYSASSQLQPPAEPFRILPPASSDRTTCPDRCELRSPRAGTRGNRKRSEACQSSFRNSLILWCREEDSNLRPAHYECAALPAELSRRASRGKPRILHFFAQPDDQIDARHLGPGRWWRQAPERHRWNGNVDQSAALEVVKVVVRLDIGVEPGARAVHRQLANEAVRGEQVQRVVHRGFGHARTGGAQACQDLLRGEVLGR